MVIRHSIEAMSANGQFNITSKSLQKSTQKLSSGYRINSAADDAAGLSISEKMRKQIRGLTRASANAEDGISLVQIADGALEEVQSMLQRMNELCVQAANGTNSDTDRTYIQDEVTELTTEIDRIAATTKFNEINLLDGSIEKPGRTEENIKLNNEKVDEVIRSYENYYKYSTNANNTNTYTALSGERAGETVSQDDVDNTSGLKIIYTVDEVVTTQSTNGSKSTLTGAKYDNLKNMLRNEIVPNAVLAIFDKYNYAFSFLKNSSIGIGLELYTDNNSSTLASVTAGTSTAGNFMSYKLSVNMASLRLDSNGNITEENRRKLEATVIHEMMHAFMDESLTNGMLGVANTLSSSGAQIQFEESEQYPHWFKEGMAQTAVGGYYDGNDWIKSLGITTSTSVADIKDILSKTNNVLSSSNNNTASWYGTGYLACMYLGYLMGGRTLTETAIQTGLNNLLNSLRNGASLKEEIAYATQQTYQTISDFESNFANVAAQFVYDLTAFVGDGSGGFATGFLKRYSEDVLNDTPMTVTLFQLNTEKETVNNTYPSDYTVLSGGTTNSKGVGGEMDIKGGEYPDGTNGTLPPVYTKTPTTTGSGGSSGSTNSRAAFKRAHGNGLAIHAGADSDIKNKIFIYIDAMDSESLGISDVDVSTVDAATISIERVALALTQVSTQRSELGAYQNRLEHTIKNLDNVVENTTASESLIRDTDMATELVKYSNANIIAQAGQAMLAQANQSKEGILALVG